MVNENIFNYLKQGLSSGLHMDEMQKNLLAQGWDKAEVDAAVAKVTQGDKPEVSKEVNAPVQSAAAPVQPATPIQSTTSAQPASATSPQSAATSQGVPSLPTSAPATAANAVSPTQSTTAAVDTSKSESQPTSAAQPASATSATAASTAVSQPTKKDSVASQSATSKQSTATTPQFITSAKAQPAATASNAGSTQPTKKGSALQSFFSSKRNLIIMFSVIIVVALVILVLTSSGSATQNTPSTSLNIQTGRAIAFTNEKTYLNVGGEPTLFEIKGVDEYIVRYTLGKFTSELYMKENVSVDSNLDDTEDVFLRLEGTQDGVATIYVEAI